jgi:deoxyribonuclease-4
MYFGAHLTVSGGIQNTVEAATHLELNVMQIYTKNPRQWFSSKLKEDEIDEYLENVKVYDIKKIFSHASHLLNISSHDKAILEKSQRSFLDEINRAEILNLEGVIFHPGSFAGRHAPDGLKICSESINFLIENTRRYNTKLIIENMPGEGRQICRTFEEIRTVLDGVTEPRRVAFCLDTAHLFQAGYNVKTFRNYLKVMNELEKIIGFKHLSAIHLNDSAKPMGSRIDRHANICQGLMGRDFFYNLLHDKRLKHVPFILETPGDMAGYQKDLETVRAIVAEKKFRI